MLRQDPHGDWFFYANEETPSKCTVFYLHGGAYLNDFSPFHWRFLEKLVEEIDAMVITPAYRLIPFATWEDAFDLIVQEGMMHVYPLMPIPEAQAAHEVIFEKVTR